jgi:TPR repeat protein
VHGEGGRKDVELGLAYLATGAQLGDSDAMQWLAALYSEGRAVEQDDVEARRLYAASAAQGNWSGQTNLGVMAEYGRGGPADPELAAESYRAAMAQGFDMAGANMARLIRANGDIDPRPLAAEAHCLWAQEMSTREAIPADTWTAYCRMVLSNLAPEEVNAARALAGELTES